MPKQEEDLRRNHLPRSSPRARGLTRSGGDLAPPAGHAETELVVPPERVAPSMALLVLRLGLHVPIPPAALRLWVTPPPGCLTS